MSEPVDLEIKSKHILKDVHIDVGIVNSTIITKDNCTVVFVHDEDCPIVMQQCLKFRNEYYCVAKNVDYYSAYRLSDITDIVGGKRVFSGRTLAFSSDFSNKIVLRVNNDPECLIIFEGDNIVPETKYYIDPDIKKIDNDPKSIGNGMSYYYIYKDLYINKSKTGIKKTHACHVRKVERIKDTGEYSEHYASYKNYTTAMNSIGNQTIHHKMELCHSRSEHKKGVPIDIFKCQKYMSILHEGESGSSSIKKNFTSILAKTDEITVAVNKGISASFAIHYEKEWKASKDYPLALISHSDFTLRYLIKYSRLQNNITERCLVRTNCITHKRKKYIVGTRQIYGPDERSNGYGITIILCDAIYPTKFFMRDIFFDSTLFPHHVDGTSRYSTYVIPEMTSRKLKIFNLVSASVSGTNLTLLLELHKNSAISSAMAVLEINLFDLFGLYTLFNNIPSHFSDIVLINDPIIDRPIIIEQSNIKKRKQNKDRPNKKKKQKKFK